VASAGRAVDDAQQRADRELAPYVKPGLNVFPSPCVVSRSKTNRGVREIDMIPWLRDELLSFRAAVGTPNLNAPVFPHARAHRGRRTA
jgi:hypothetical protein